MSGFLQVRARWQEDTTLTQSVNHLRVAIDGPLPSHFSYKIEVELEALGNPAATAGVSLRDGFGRWTLKPWTITFGQFKTPFSAEYLLSDKQIETPDRAVVADSFATRRDVGTAVEWAPKDQFALSAGVFNGEGQNAFANRDSTVMVVGRVVLRPFSYLRLGASAARFREDSTRWGAEAWIDHEKCLLRGEYIAEQGVRQRKDDFGWYVLAGYQARPWLQLIARQEDFIREPFAARRITTTTAGINLLPAGGRAMIQLVYQARKVGSPRVHRDAVVAQAQVVF